MPLRREHVDWGLIHSPCASSFWGQWLLIGAWKLCPRLWRLACRQTPPSAERVPWEAHLWLSSQWPSTAGNAVMSPLQSGRKMVFICLEGVCGNQSKWILWRQVLWWRNDCSSLSLAGLCGAETRRHWVNGTEGLSAQSSGGRAGSSGPRNPALPSRCMGLQWPASSGQTAQSFPQGQQTPTPAGFDISARALTDRGLVLGCPRRPVRVYSKSSLNLLIYCPCRLVVDPSLLPACSQGTPETIA